MILISYKSFKISPSLEENLSFFKTLAGQDKTVKIRSFESSKSPQIKAGIVFIDGLVSELIINQNIIGPILTFESPDGSANTSDWVFNLVYENILFGGDIAKSSDINLIFQNLFTGNSLLFVEALQNASLFLQKDGWYAL
ncbi:MAG: spore germination protein [Firmicutes bacterium]|nr:spore germination protein [Bacillota bacterium]